MKGVVGLDKKGKCMKQPRGGATTHPIWDYPGRVRDNLLIGGEIQGGKAKGGGLKN